MSITPLYKSIGRWFLAGCRIFVGVLVAKTGIGLLQGLPFRGYNRQDDLFIGGFVLLLGAYIIFSTLFSLFFPDKKI